MSDICAYRVKFLGKNGTEKDLERAMRALVVSHIYDVKKIEIEDWVTHVYLRGVSGFFNSVMFEPAREVEGGE